MQTQVTLSKLALAAVVITCAMKGRAQPLTVVVHDYAGVDQRVLQRAESEAARILRTAGVELNWIDCRDSFEQPQQCQDPPDSTELVLHLLPARATRRDLPAGAMGFALPPESGSFGFFCGVLYDRVERLSSLMLSESVLLGHAMAHELGHLLLGVGGHARNGIMQAEWNPEALRKAAEGTLVFTSSERREVQQNVRQRLEARENTIARK